MKIIIKDSAGTFAENKDIARELRVEVITPQLRLGNKVLLDFEDVTGATQSFVHALISELIREFGDEVFTLLLFQNCNPIVQEIVMMVAEYMEEI